MLITAAIDHHPMRNCCIRSPTTAFPMIAVVMATPKAEHADRAVLKAALAAPSCSSGTSCRAAAFAGPSMNAIPTPMEIVPGKNARM